MHLVQLTASVLIFAGTLGTSGQQIQIQYENNNLFATQVQTMYGTRFDYKVSPKLNVGATLEQPNAHRADLFNGTGVRLGRVVSSSW